MALCLMSFCLPLTNDLTWNLDKFGIVGWVAEIRDAISVISTTCRKHHSMDSTHKQPIRPVIEQIPYIDKNRRKVVVFRSGGEYRHGRPTLVWCQNLEPRLSSSLEKKGE